MSMSTVGVERKARPAYPSAGRQWLGIFLIALAVGCLEALAQYGIHVGSPGSILLFCIVVVTYVSGLRTGLVSVGLCFLYLLYAYSSPALFEYSARNLSRLITLAVLFPGAAFLVGYVQGSLTRAAIREYDAREAAESEAAHRREAEGSLRYSEDMWRLVVNSALDGIVAIRRDGRITLWNRSAETMFGWRVDEIIGQKLSETIVPPSYREAHENGLRHFLDTGEANILGKRLELPALAKDGREFPIELSVVTHETTEGPLFIGFVRDLTEQKKLNERLRQAQKMEAIGTLAGGVAHDFNNILTTISGNLVLAQADLAKDHPSQESLSEIEKAISRATYVVKQILTFGRVKETKRELVDLADTLDEAINVLRVTLPPSVEIETHFEPDLPAILADRTDVHQIILNLGINAHHAMQGQNGRFEIQVNRIAIDAVTAESLLRIAPGDYVRLSIGDTGCGMAPQVLQRIFEPFFTTKEQGQGTGLGLSVVYGIVERHGGAITVYSEPGKGTVFHIYFPAVGTPSAKPKPKEEVSRRGNGERILYVDDDEAIVYMMSRMLRRLNYDVTGFQHPMEALVAFQANPDGFDLVITDMSMPHMNGPNLVHALRAVRANIPIIMVTGYIRPTDLEQARDLGIAELILKPNTVSEMSEKLHDVLKGLRIPT